MRKFFAGIFVFSLIVSTFVSVQATTPPNVDERLLSLVNIAYHSNYGDTQDLWVRPNGRLEHPINELGIIVKSYAELVSLFSHERIQESFANYDEAFFSNNFLIVYTTSTWYTAPHEFTITSAYENGEFVHIQITERQLPGDFLPMSQSWVIILEIDNLLLDMGFAISHWVYWQRWDLWDLVPHAYIQPPINKYEIRHNISYFGEGCCGGISGIESWIWDGVPFNTGIGAKKINTKQDLTEQFLYSDWLRNHGIPHQAYNRNLLELISRYNSSFFENYFLVYIQSDISVSGPYFRVTSIQSFENAFTIELRWGMASRYAAASPSVLGAFVEVSREYMNKNFTLSLQLQNGERVSIPIPPLNYYPASIIPGDVNGDGRVTSADATLIARYLAGHDVTINHAASLNGNGRITQLDLLALVRLLVGA